MRNISVNLFELGPVVNKETFLKDISIFSRGTKVAYRAKTHIFFAPERYTAGILFIDSLNSA